MLLGGSRLCGSRSNGKRLRNAAFTTINRSIIMVIVLAESLQPIRWAKINAVKLPIATEPSLTSGVEYKKSGSEKTAVAIERTVGCNLGKPIGFTSTRGRIV